MPSISDIIKNKTTRDQARTEQRQMERENLSAMRDGSLSLITSSPEHYRQYLDLQADNIHCSVGNVALTMAQLQGATRIGTTTYWHGLGRYVRDDAISAGATVFVPPRNKQYRGYFMGSYYDVSQTTGRPLKESVPLAEGSERMNTAFAALLDTAPVGFVENTKLDAPARYNERNCVLEINTEYSAGQVFAALATEISFARLHDRGMNRDYDRGAFQLNAESVGFMVCRRFGVDCPLPDAAGVQQFYSYYSPDDRGKSLDFMRQTARNMGDTVERGIQPRQQEHTASRGSNNRQYGRR